MGKIYHYHPDTGIYTVSTDALQDPADPTRDIVPAHATTTPPPVVLDAYKAAVFDGNTQTWSEQYIYSEFRLFSTVTGKEVDNNLVIGQDLPPDTTPLDPRHVDYPKWDGSKWVTDPVLKNQHDFTIEIETATEHFEEALKLLADNEVRKSIPGARVLSQSDEAEIKQYIVDEEKYIDLLRKTGPSLIATKNVNEPAWPLSGKPSHLNVEIFSSVHPGPTAGIQAVAWTPNTQFSNGQLIYGPNNEGLFVATQDFMSNPVIGTDIAQAVMVSVIPDRTGLRYAPVADLAGLAALAAEDYAICKVLDTGDEYVFYAGATSGDVRDNNNTGFWNQVRSPQHGRYLTYSAEVHQSSYDIDIGIQPFDVDHMLVFVNGDLRVDTEYTFNEGTGVITLDQELQPNDNWKVLVMS